MWSVLAGDPCGQCWQVVRVVSLLHCSILAQQDTHMHTWYRVSVVSLSVTCSISIDEAVDYAKQMLGSRLVTKQTGEKGRPCNKVRGEST